MRRVFAGSCVFALFFYAGLFASRNERISQANERQGAFAWMTRLGYPDVQGLKFVLVSTGHWMQAGNAPPTNGYQHAFLVKDEGESFIVRTVELELRQFKKTPPGTEAYRSIGFEVIDLEQEALAWVADMKADPKERTSSRRTDHDMGIRFSTRTYAFLLAWACSRQGLGATADTLYEFAQDSRHNVDGETRRSLHSKVADELASIEMWRSILAFSDPTIARTQLLEQFERIKRNFPRSRYYARAVETAAILKKMVAEDMLHKTEHAIGKPFDQLPRSEQVAELIFQLRDQNGHQYMQPGHAAWRLRHLRQVGRQVGNAGT